ncbi:aminoimidazole riboside kinase [Neisseria leonii]|uniref:aminoimidazole riboside kinase n=1 Tax=Neisseria leonii TaxID=2995413 RepID=UPI00237C259C|nr:aminoimidazole riboside kinase [Neisseria sp. 3986]MDD9325390.1 aminoimidazole riboside kinase [Neisseria sp. 3986]
MSRIWVLGDAVVDLIPDGRQHYLKCPGGAPANVAVGAARLGIETGFIGRVGDDPPGRFMLETLRAEGVATEHMILDPDHRTSTVIVDLDQGERSFTFMVNPSADQFLQSGDLPHFSAGDYLHCCSIALINEPSRSATLEAVRRIKAAGGRFSFDPNLRETLWPSAEEMKTTVNRVAAMADIVKFSEEELTLLTGITAPDEAARTLAAQSPEQLIVVTLGADGAAYYFRGQSGRVAGRPLQPVDTTGAGDAFVSGLLAGLYRAGNLHDEAVLAEAVRQANACGALATTAKGAMPALPDRAGLAAFLAGRDDTAPAEAV